MNSILEQLSAIHTDCVMVRLDDGKVYSLPRFLFEPELMPPPVIKRVRIWWSIDGLGYPIRYARFIRDERIKLAELNNPPST